MRYVPGTPINHDTDEFAHFEREIARQRGINPDSLHKRSKLTVGTPTVTKADTFGKATTAAIKGAANPGVDIKAAWFDEYPIGPSSYYNDVKPLGIGNVVFQPKRPEDHLAADLLYRPNDRITLEARKLPLTGPFTIKGTVSSQVGGTHYGNPATDVYAFAMANELDAMQFNVVKYVTRFRKKDGMKDLLKAKQTLERLIAHEEGRK